MNPLGTEARNAAPAHPAEFALTPLQLGMVYESTLAGLPWVNLEQVIVHLDDEELDCAALRRAWLEVAARHDALRLSILWRKRVTPMQIVRDRAEVAFTTEDWGQMTPRKQAAALAQFLDTDRERGVDLEASPPWRVTVLRLGPRRSVMVWTVHHAVVDGRSMAIVLQEVFEALAGRLAPLSPAVSFTQFFQALETVDRAKSEAFFRAELSGFDQPNSIAAADDTTSSPARKLQIEQRLDADLSRALEARAAESGATLANLVHAAWGLLVARWSGDASAVFGVTRAGRHLLPGCDRTVGCLINTVPIRVATPFDASGTDALLARLRAGTLALHGHEHAALTDIRRWCEVPGTLPLFESMVMFERETLGQTMARLGPGWANRRVELREEGAMPVTLAVYGGPEILLMLEHDPTSVPAAKAAEMLSHMAEVLASLAGSIPQTPLSHLGMLPCADTAALLALGHPDMALPHAIPCLATRLETAAAAHANKLALSMIGAGPPLSHADLNRAANGLAFTLCEQGAGPGSIVAICLERSPEFVVAMLAVLKTGAAFLPIDPGYPQPVADHMLTDSAAGFIIAAPGSVAPPPGLRLISTHSLARADAPPRPAPDPDRLAYVIYTSGSTGVPKGVRVPMRAISAHASAIGAAFALTASDRVLQFASLSFDVSIEEVIPTLLAGAHLVMRDADMAGSVPRFLEAVAESGITVLNLPTAFWHVVVDDMARNSRVLPEAVRLVIVGGEQISPRALATWQRIAPGPRWLNGYGPTETTITCTLHEPRALPPGEDIPIGRPTAHALAYVLAADGSLAPKGAVGDLWIGGLAVSDGYIGREDKTAAAFRPDHLAGTGRIYRTGDRARWREDGSLAFLGRRDRQVKLRGFRIDLREVERVLERDPSTGRALARVIGKGTPVARLVAWVTGAEGMPPPDAATLRRAVEAHLPPHMMPTLVPVADFPRTTGGKIDLAALPEPSPAVSAPSVAEDLDATTAAICALMAQTLGLPSIGPDDDFHDLGGHSLLAVQLIGRIEEVLGHRLGVGDLHRRPTPRALAAALNKAQTGPRYIIPIQPMGSQPPLFGVHVLGRNEEYYRPLAATLGPDQPVFGLSVGLLTHDTPIGVEDTAARYFDDIQQHYPNGPISLLAVSLGSYIAFELARQLKAAGREVRLLALFDAEGPEGRSKIHGRARLLAHIHRARAEGLGYPLHLVSNRLTDLKNRVEKARVRIASAKGAAAPLTIGTFVAANELAVQAYEAHPITVPLTIFRAASDVFDSPESAKSGLGWASVAEAGFRVIDVPGDHLSILQPPNVSVLAQHIARILRKA